MEDSDVMEDSEQEYYSDEDDDEQCFESEPVQAATSSFEGFDAAGCLELAQAEVRSVSELLCCSCDVSALLLRHFRWDREKLTDGAHTLPCFPLVSAAHARARHGRALLPRASAVYMTDPDKALEKVGVVAEDHSVLHRGEMVLVSGVERVGTGLTPKTCQVCYESTTMYSALECGHPFCNECYATFIEHKVADEGHDCIYARCPEPKVLATRQSRARRPPRAHARARRAPTPLRRPPVPRRAVGEARALAAQAGRAAQAVRERRAARALVRGRQRELQVVPGRRLRPRDPRAQGAAGREVQVQPPLVLHVQRRRPPPRVVRRAEEVAGQVPRRLGDVQLARLQHEAVPEVRHLDREEWRLQPQ